MISPAETRHERALNGDLLRADIAEQFGPDWRALPRLLAIDPGPLLSAYLYLIGDRPGLFGIEPNAVLLERLRTLAPGVVGAVVIEKVEGYGMPVGIEIFETVYWSGRFAEAADPTPVERIGRKAVKVHLCGTTKAKDQNVRQALLDRFGGVVEAKRKGGPLRGISGDVWAALAVAVAWTDGVR